MSTALLPKAGEDFATLVIFPAYSPKADTRTRRRDPPYAKPRSYIKKSSIHNCGFSVYPSLGPALGLQLIAETRVEAAHLRRHSTHRTALEEICLASAHPETLSYWNR